MKIIAESPASSTAKKKLAKMGIADEDANNMAVVANSLYKKAVDGNIQAIEKWEQLTAASKDDDEKFVSPDKIAELLKDGYSYGRSRKTANKVKDAVKVQFEIDATQLKPNNTAQIHGPIRNTAQIHGPIRKDPNRIIPVPKKKKTLPRTISLRVATFTNSH